jgi:hypothetical protein
MKRFGRCGLVVMLVITTAVVVAGKEPVPEMSQHSEYGLKIQNFTDDSTLKTAGAMIGDIIVSYNGSKVLTVEMLQSLQAKVTDNEVVIGIVRSGQEMAYKVPKGQLGVYLKVVAPEHKRDSDAVIIDGLGRIGWGMGMENSFFGCLTRLEEKFGQSTSYEDLVGLSGYGFRFHFFDCWCPSSPDATCGKDVGSGMLQKLGYSHQYYALDTLSQDTVPMETRKSETQMRELIVKSIDAGWPVIAIDLIQVPEWGLITGYQKAGKELFCRTYFDQTEGYEIAKKMPWVMVVITGKKPVDTAPLFSASLKDAVLMYETPKYDQYFSGLKALEVWIHALKDDPSFSVGDSEKFKGICLANWWSYYSLAVARGNVVHYLESNQKRFNTDEATIGKLIHLYSEEVKLLEDGMGFVTCPHTMKDPGEWTKEKRHEQAEVLEKVLAVESAAVDILKKLP